MTTLKRSIAYLVRWVIQLRQRSITQQINARIGPTPQLGRFCVGWKSLACSQAFTARDKSLSARGTLDTLKVDAAHFGMRN
jgi:hypothetical protein